MKSGALHRQIQVEANSYLCFPTAPEKRRDKQTHDMNMCQLFLFCLMELAVPTSWHESFIFTFLFCEPDYVSH